MPYRDNLPLLFLSFLFPWKSRVQAAAVYFQLNGGDLISVFCVFVCGDAAMLHGSAWCCWLLATAGYIGWLGGVSGVRFWVLS